MTFTTTAGAIRDRAHDVIEALTPKLLSAPKFVRYRNEGPADFSTWAANNVEGALRRFQVRDEGVDEPPTISNTDIERHQVNLIVIVAYPQDARAGRKNGLSRDDLIDTDFRQINFAIGMCGRVNFTGSTYDAMWIGGGRKDIHRGRVCDLLMIHQSYIYNLVAG